MRLARLEAALAAEAPAATLPKLLALTRAALEAWPFELSPARWATFLPPREALGAVDGPGLYLAAATLEGVPSALEAFDAELRAAAGPACRRLALDPSAADEVLQAARTHLLVAERGATRLEAWSGRAPLRDWLTTVVARLALDRQRRQRDVQSLGAAAHQPAVGLDPELAVLRADQRQQLSDAIEAALATLTPRQRALLRLHVVEHLSIDELAPMFDASRASLARWVDEARQALGAATRDLLGARLALAPAELESLLGPSGRSLELSLERLLAQDTKEP